MKDAAAEQKDIKAVYQITRKLHGDRGQNQDLTVKGIDSSTITEKRQSQRDGEHFQQLLSRCDLPTLADICEAEQDLDIELGSITVQEVEDAIKKLMNGKAQGDDNVYA